MKDCFLLLPHEWCGKSNENNNIQDGYSFNEIILWKQTMNLKQYIKEISDK